MSNEKLEFKLKSKDEVLILQDGKQVGHIFTPAGTGHDEINAIQICGFSEAFDYWGCGVFKGYKDIQLLFDGKKLEGKFELSNCWCCFHNPCQCETEKDKKTNVTKGPPFIAKGNHSLRFRIKYNKDSPHYITDEIIESVNLLNELKKEHMKLQNIRNGMRKSMKYVDEPMKKDLSNISQILLEKQKELFSESSKIEEHLKFLQAGDKR